jgi:hypothetical protein
MDTAASNFHCHVLGTYGMVPEVRSIAENKPVNLLTTASNVEWGCK